MAANVKLIGKSLLKYLKPIRIGSTETDLPEKKSKGFYLLPKPKTKKSTSSIEAKVEDTSNALKTSHPEELEEEAQLAPPSEDGSWLEQVEYISHVCKKTSGKMAGKFGISSYKNVLDTQVRQKIKVVGSIVNVMNGKEDVAKLVKEEIAASENTSTKKISKKEAA